MTGRLGHVSTPMSDHTIHTKQTNAKTNKQTNKQYTNATKQNRQRNHVWSGAVESKSLSHWKRETKENLIIVEMS